MNAAPALWHRHAAFAYGAVFIGVIGHATTEFVQVLSGVAGPELSVWRFTLGAVGLVIVCLAIPGARDLWTPLREAFVPIVTLSLLGFAIAYLAFHWALDFASVPQVATTVTTIPIFLALINLWRNGQPIGWLKWVTGIAALVGIALLITDGALTQLAGDGRNLFGVFLALVCALFVGGFMIFAKPYFARYGALRMTTIAIVITAVGLWFGVGLFFGRWVDFTTMATMPAGQITALVTIGFFNTTITQWFWLGGLAAAPDITRAAYLFFLKPVIAAVLALWILQQAVTPMEWLAIVIICGAVAFEALWPRLAGRFGRRAEAGS